MLGERGIGLMAAVLGMALAVLVVSMSAKIATETGQVMEVAKQTSTSPVNRIDRQCGAVEHETALANVSVESHFTGPVGDDPMSYIRSKHYSLKVRGRVTNKTDLKLVRTSDCKDRLVHDGGTFIVASLKRQ